jgi:tyrosine-protein kinase Etk/Wzc
MPNTFSNNKKSSVNFLPSQDDDENNINLGKLLATLANNKWRIAFITVIVMIIGTTYSFLSIPIYKAVALLQVQQSQGVLQKVIHLQQEADIIETKLPTMSEIEIIKSRMILKDAVKNLNLEITAKPKYFPVIGEAIRRFQQHNTNTRPFLQHNARQFQQHNEVGEVSSPLFGQSGYAWGGESIHVDTFEVPTNGLDKKFILIAGKQGNFRLMYEDEFVLEGEVGKPVIKQMEYEQQSITLFVSELKSRPDTQFIIMRQSEDDAIDKLKASFSVSEKSKETGIIQLTMESTSPDLAFQTLNEIANIYIRQNVEQKSAEAQKTLEYLEKQLPFLEKQVEASTSALNSYKTLKGSVDLDKETQNILNVIVGLKTEVTLLEQKSIELRTKFTQWHPSIIAIENQIARLQEQINANQKKVEALPNTQQVILGLSSDVKVDTELYNTLINNAQTLRVSKAGTMSNVRIIDYAVLPKTPIQPKKALIVAVSIILGLILGIAWVFIRQWSNFSVNDPDMIEKQLNIPVYAIIPHSAQQQKIDIKLRKKQKQSNVLSILALENKDDLAIESLRSLRTTLHFAFLEAQNNIIMITGPSPGVGKTFISINLATVLADAGKKILLIDGDLRKGFIYKNLGVSREQGLSEFISNTIALDVVTHKVPLANFDFIPNGSIPPNPSELLLHKRFGDLLTNISKHYDHVIIDSPPVLAVTDAAIIGRIASVTLMVVKAGQHPMRELEQSTKRLLQAGVNIKGILFNDVPESSSSYRHEYGKYVYQYSYQKWGVVE